MSNATVFILLLVLMFNYQLVFAQSEAEDDSESETTGEDSPEKSTYFDVEYNYTEPKVWSLTYPACVGIQQSPVEIDPVSTKSHPSNQRLYWISYDEDPDNMNVRNNGALVTIHGVWRGWPHIAGGILRGTYKFVEMRFHWGLSPLKGSEHLIKGQQASMEIQFVHYKSDYDTLENALLFPDGVAIISRFFVSSKTAKASYLDELGEMLMNITAPESDIDFAGFALDKLNPPFRSYYTYLGSLTQPPCSESVIWIVCPETLLIPTSIWELFITLQSKTDGIMGDNIRPPQELNSRVITKIF